MSFINDITLCCRFLDGYRLGLEQRFNSLVANYFDNDLVKVEIFVSFLTSMVQYWVVGLLYTLIDLTGKPAFFLKYKTQPPENSQVNRKNLIKLLKQVLFNQIMALVLSVNYFRFRHTYMTPSAEMPTLARILLDFVLFQLIREVFFYYGHRWLHHPRLYKYIHKQHHEWTSPIAIAAIYCNPIEHLLANLFPVLIGKSDPFLI